MAENLQIDNLDRKILDIITKNARIPYLEVARECNVSGAAIHQRVQRLIRVGVIKGSEFKVDPSAKKLTYTIKASESTDTTYLPRRAADVVLSTGETIGQFGIVHPGVLKQFELEQHAPCSILEINIEPFL